MKDDKDIHMRALCDLQKSELMEHMVYYDLAMNLKDAKNRAVLERIAKDELRHYHIMKHITGEDTALDRLGVFWYTSVSRMLGLSFGLKLMENREKNEKRAYAKLEKDYPAVAKIMNDGEEHEHQLRGALSEEALEYASSIVLGLNDALVELSGTLAGFTFALGNAQLIGLSGLIVGVAAALSMATSHYLSEKEGNGRDPKKSAVYTGITYMAIVLLLVAPYLLLSSVYASLAAMVAMTFVIIGGYTFYITTAKNQKFVPKFTEMAIISAGVGIISFVFGLLLKKYYGV
ncbi:VIT family protein [uncultured archaeon]|nr:VIT family protein [uncultured archaeon]